MKNSPVDPESVVELLDYCIESAKDKLTRYGEFYPFGMMIDYKGEFITIGLNEGDAPPSSERLYAVIQAEIKRRFTQGTIMAAALASDVTVPQDLEVDYPDGIRVIVESKGYARMVYVPYWIDRRGPSEQYSRQLRSLQCAETISMETDPTLTQ